MSALRLLHSASSHRIFFPNSKTSSSSPTATISSPALRLLQQLFLLLIFFSTTRPPSSASDSFCSEHGEGLQVLHYEVGQKYEPHYNFFLDDYNTKNGVYVWLCSDIEEGVETVFLSVKGNIGFHGLYQCGKEGLSVKPKMGDALLF